MRALRKTRAGGCAIACCCVLLAGCGGDDFKNDPRPAAAIELTGVIQDRGVTISPGSVSGAGPVSITISNQTNDAHTVTLEGDSVEETVGPINPRDTATIQKTLAGGTYEVKAGSERAVAKEIPAGSLKVGAKKRESSGELLLP
jgi:hypothetical protein